MQTLRVLVVDDNALNVELAAYVLGAAGIAVEAAASAEEALVRVAGSAPDLVLMDIQMGGIDGLTLTRQLKADSATRHIVIVAFTAYAMRGDEERFRAAGCDGYISKPIDVARFADQVLSFAAAGRRPLHD